MLFADCYMEYNYGMLRDYRIVKMADASGTMRYGVFIPFLQNGIRWNPEDDRPPIQYIRFAWKPNGTGREHVLIPFITAQQKEDMIREGVIDPKDKNPVGRVGFVYKNKNNYGNR
jgi:hypothetical protein